LFTLHEEAMMKEATENTQEGITVGGEISIIRFVDDKAMAASTQKDLQNLMGNRSRL